MESEEIRKLIETARLAAESWLNLSQAMLHIAEEMSEAFKAQKEFFEFQLRAQRGVMRRSGVSAEQPELVTTELPSGVAGMGYEGEIIFKHHPYEVVVEGLPSSLVYDATKRAIVGQPDMAGEFELKVIGKSDFGDQEGELVLVVEEPIEEPNEDSVEN